ncbi:13157_t:CDS:2, partial [Acaulospora morrowiae]
MRGILRYSEDISVICAFNTTSPELNVEVEKYIDNVFNNDEKKYEIVALEIHDEPFQIYIVKKYFLT